MAYKVKITVPKCRCGGKAGYEVFNNKNASAGYFCGRCAYRQIKQLDWNERLDREGHP